jgi:hypothetical protein
MKYVASGSAALERRAFVAPRLRGREDPLQHSYAVFFNFDKPTAVGSDLPRQILELGLVSRSWGLNDPRSWQSALNQGVHHLATDRVSVAEYPWASTQSSDGAPFQIIPRSVGH